MSNDGANSAASDLRRGVVTVVPLTSNVAKVFPFQVLLPAADTGLDLDSKALAEQVRAVDVRRVGPRLGELTAPQLLALDRALRLHLAL